MLSRNQVSPSVRDLRYTLRLWSRSPRHAGFAIAALAIGIGANVGVFSVVQSLTNCRPSNTCGVRRTSGFVQIAISPQPA